MYPSSIVCFIWANFFREKKLLSESFDEWWSSSLSKNRLYVPQLIPGPYKYHTHTIYLIDNKTD